MYDAGARDWMDGLSFHAYPGYPPGSGKPERFHETLATVRSLVATRDYAGRRLWADEVGAALSGTYVPYSESQQASELLSHYEELAQGPDVDAVMFHTLIDGGNWGWLKPRDSEGRIYPRPVYCAFARRLGRFAPRIRGPATRKARARKRHKIRRSKGQRSAPRRAIRRKPARRVRARARRHAVRQSTPRLSCAAPLDLTPAP